MTVFKGYINGIEAYRVDGTDIGSKDEDALQIIVTLQFVSEGDIKHFVHSNGEDVIHDRIYRHLKRLRKMIENYKVRVPQPKTKTSLPDQPNKSRDPSK